MNATTTTTTTNTNANATNAQAGAPNAARRGESLEGWLCRKQLDQETCDRIDEAVANLVCEVADCGIDGVEDIDYDCSGDYAIIWYATCHMVDNGIGPYEYWGCCGVDHRWEPEADEDEETLDLDGACLARFGLAAETKDEDTDYDGVDADGGTCTCRARVIAYVADEAAFLAWLAQEGIKIGEKAA